jgi:hypothetical protein
MRHRALLLLLSACAGDPAPNARLADLTNIHLSVQGWDPSDTEPTTGFVALSYDAGAFRAAHGGACAVLDGSFRGTVDGVTLDVDAGGGPDDLDDCSPPALALDSGLDGATSFVIGDDSLTITAEFAAEAFAPHEPTLRSPSTWRFAAGQAVVVGWSRPEDLVGLGTEPGQIYFHTGTLSDPNFFDLSASHTGDEIRFTIPDPAPITGAGLIVFRFGYSNGSAATCTGAASCTYSSTRGYVHSVHIDP